VSDDWLIGIVLIVSLVVLLLIIKFSNKKML